MLEKLASSILMGRAFFIKNIQLKKYNVMA